MGETLTENQFKEYLEDEPLAYDVLVEHDRQQRAEIERLADLLRQHQTMVCTLERTLQKTRHERDRQLAIREAEQRKWGAKRMQLVLEAKKRAGSRAIILRAETAEAVISEIVAICQENSDAEVTDPVEGVNDLVRACNTFAHRHIEMEAEIAGKKILIADREQQIGELHAELSRLRDSARVRDARYIGVIEALLHGIDEYWEEHDGRETVLDAIRLVEESKP